MGIIFFFIILPAILLYFVIKKDIEGGKQYTDEEILDNINKLNQSKENERDIRCKD